MARFSGRGAVGAGFRLIGREPLAFLAWVVAFTVVGLLPQFWIAAQMMAAMPELMKASQAAAAQGVAPPPEAMMQAQMRIVALQPIAMLGSLVANTLVLGAVFRAVLTPADRAFFYLRLSAHEMWLGIMLAVVFVIYMIGAFAVMIPVFIVAGIAIGVGKGAGAVVAVPVAFAGFAVIIWGVLRVSLALPMSFEDANFRLSEAWMASRGQAGKMFGVAVVLSLIALVVEIVAIGGLFVALGGPKRLMASGPSTNPMEMLAHISPAVWIGGLTILALLSTGYITLYAAAWAKIHAELRDSRAETEPAVA